MPRPPGPALAGALMAAMLLLAGCGAGANPEPYPPSGVDELVIPTPDPDPDDFVARIDNAYLPLTPGTVWTYAATGSAGRMVVQVQDRTETVAGVRCVVVRQRETTEGGEVLRESEQFYAQDTRGNVWLFGEQSVSETTGPSWRAGQAGAEAGLAMPATPRVGDGFLRASAPGVVEERVTVVALDAQRTVPAGTFGGLLLTQDVVEAQDAGEFGAAGSIETVERTYAAGTGLLEQVGVEGDTADLSLVSVAPGP